MRYFEDFQVGDVIELGSVTVTKEEIINFASQFDPQPFHIDEEAAQHSFFGGIIASGWHTGSLFMRLYVTGLLHDTTSMGSPGVDELRWLKPVRPDDTLTGRMTIIETIPSKSRPEMGIIRIKSEMYNQRGEAVMSMLGLGMFGRRPTE